MRGKDGKLGRQLTEVSVFLGMLAMLWAPATAFGQSGDASSLAYPSLQTPNLSTTDPELNAASSCSPASGNNALGGPCSRLKAAEPHSNSASMRPLKPRHEGAIAAAVTNEAGDVLEVSTARAGSLYRKEGSLWASCAYFFPYVGASYVPCGYVSAYDAARGSSKKIPMTNWSEDVIYDACGKKVNIGETYGWHITGTEYWNSPSFVLGTMHSVSSSTPLECLGNWTMTFSFKQTFSDGETLTESVTVPFLVTLLPIPPSATWGGGNPGELPCSQVCGGDPVNTATGDYWESFDDLSIDGRGPGLHMNRTYSSLAAESQEYSTMGYGWAFPYDMRVSIMPNGQTDVVNANGSRTTFNATATGYSAPPRVLAKLVQNSDGSYVYTVRERTTYTFNPAGKLTSITDLNGNKTTLSYNEAGRLQAATDGAGRAFTFSYNEAGQLIGVKDSSGRSVAYGYNGSGRLSEVTDVRGGHTYFEYDEAGLLQSYKDARGNVVVTNTYDSNGRVTSQKDALEHETTFSYTSIAEGTITDETDPRGNVTEYEYIKGALAKRTEAAGTESAATWTYEHDPYTLGVTGVTDPNGHTGHATYDSRGNQTSAEDAAGHKTKAKYDTLDNLLESTDANGVTTTYTYDTRGNLLTESTPLVGSEPAQSRTTTYAYENKTFPGDITAITNPNGRTTTYTYDTAGNLASATDAFGNKTTYTYDGLGRRLTRVAPRGNAKNSKPSEYTTTYAYDAEGNRLSVTDPLSRKRSWTYDANGNVATETDANTRTTTYDALNRTTSVKRANGSTLKSSYDANGNLASQTDGLEHVTSYAYDAFDHLQSTTDPLSRTTSYVYDAVGNLKSKTDPKERVTSFVYDPANRLTEATYSDGVTPAVKFGYDAIGHRTSMSDGTGSSSFAFDSLGRLTEAVTGHGEKMTYRYDLGGNLTSLVYPNGKTVTRTYDLAERLASVSDWLGNKTSFTYDADSNLTGTTFPSASGNIDTYAYNRADQMTGVTVAKSKTTLASLAYTRDNTGQLTGETPTGLPGAAQTFTYDTINRLTQAGPSTYAYDEADNPTTQASTSGFTYDSANELTARPNVSFSYDALGERTAATPASGPVTTYSYDQAGNLTAVKRPAEGLQPAINESYAYDGSGLRASQNVSGSTSYLTWDRSGALPLLLNDGESSYVYGPEGLPVEQISASGVPTYYHHDQLGSTRVLTNTSGTVTGTFSYGPFGGLSGSTGTQKTPLGYAGQYTNTQSGLLYLRTRVYDPATAQFLTVDPAVTSSRQSYAYAHNTPLNEADPMGLCGFDSFGDFGDCFNPTSDGNLAYQGANNVAQTISNISPPSARQLAEAYVGFFDGGTLGLTKYLRDLFGIGNGGLALCGPLYEGFEIAGTAVSAFLAPEIPAGLLKLAARYPKATDWIVQHQDELMQMKDAGEEYVRMIFGGK
jgi:RHS repeat-associated protein